MRIKVKQHKIEEIEITIRLPLYTHHLWNSTTYQEHTYNYIDKKKNSEDIEIITLYKRIFNGDEDNPKSIEYEINVEDFLPHQYNEFELTDGVCSKEAFDEVLEEMKQYLANVYVK